MKLKTVRNCHSKYSLNYHLILVTKYRKECITEEIFNFLKEHMIRIFKEYEIELIEMNYEANHVHILFSAPPQVTLSKIINTLKTTSSRKVRSNFKEHLDKYYWKPYFWSRSYLILSSGGAPIEIIKKYIQEQNN